MALPASAQMKLRPNAVPATRKRINIQPYTQPGSATNIQSVGSLIQFYVPARRNTMYDPQTMYLKGTVTYVSDNVAPADFATAQLNRNATSLINRLQVYGQDSTLLEDIQNYNILVNTLMDVQMSREDKYALSTMYGGSDGVEKANFNTAADGTALGANLGALMAQIDPKALANDNIIDIGINMPTLATEVDFAIPIVSAFGLMADTLIPVGWLNADLRFDIYLEAPNVAFRDTAAGTSIKNYRITNLELVVDTIEFDPSSMAMVAQFAPPTGPLFCHATTYKTYTSNYAAQASSTTTLIPHRSLSVKQLLFVSRPPTTDGYDMIGGRCLAFERTNPQLDLNIGGLKYPQKPIDSTPELFAELQKSQHAFNQLILNGSINRTEFARNEDECDSPAETLLSKSAIGFDLEIYDKKGNTIINGQNWTGLNVFIEGYVADSTGGATGAILTNQAFVLYDVIYVIQDGTISVRF